MMENSDAISYGLFHSFPRSWGQDTDQELREGRAILESLLQIGLLLVPEQLSFPMVLRDGVYQDEGSKIYQIRSCFTLIDRKELTHHAARFGAFSLEFDVDILRALGAFPVIYIPQPVTDSHGPAEFSMVGNNLVHQIRDVSVLLQELLELQSQVKKSVDRAATIRVFTKRMVGELNFHAVDIILDFLLGSKGSFEILLYYIEFLANLFYHSDSSRTDCYSFKTDLSYYSQREWRIVTGFASSRQQFDRELTESEAGRLERVAEFFRKPAELKGQRKLSRARASRVISEINGAPLFMSVRKFHIPDTIYADVCAELVSKGVPRDRIDAIDTRAVASARVTLPKFRPSAGGKET